MSFHEDLQGDQLYRNRTSLQLAIIIGFAFLALVARIYHLQIIKGAYHARLSDKNSMRVKVVQAPRGFIVDRHGVVMARNRPSWQIAILPTELGDPDSVFDNLMRFRDSAGERIFDSALVRWTMERGKWRKFKPLVIYEDASPELVALVEEHQLDLPGVVAEVQGRRFYPFGGAAGHLLGYMDEVTEEELESFRVMAGKTGDSLPYARGDRIGRKGIEKVYEREFRGRDGISYIKVNALGKEMEPIQDMPQVLPRPGNNVVTTIDMELQRVAEEAMADTVKGAVVAIDPRSGEVLLMLSTPRLDPNVFSLSRERKSKEWAKLALNSAMPLNNRAIVGGYEPASTFKAVVSLASFSKAGIDPHYHVPVSCKGGYRFGNRVWRCWKPEGHGPVNFFHAFKQSCDVYYYQIGLQLGMDAINEVARSFGFARKTGIDLDVERTGELVDSASYTNKFGYRGWRWTRGLILNLSMGQGQIATPLQLANYAAALGNGKVQYRPRLMKEIRDPRGNLVRRSEPEVLSRLEIAPKDHAEILKGLELVVNAPDGTGKRAAVPGVVVGGKTGSAENPHGEKTHALFIAIAPLHAPEIAIAVIKENAGGGGAEAAPVAGAILNRYFERKNGGAIQQGL